MQYVYTMQIYKILPNHLPKQLNRSTQWCGYTRGLTGVSSSGVEMGELSLFSLIPLPKSKSQIFTGEIWKRSEYNHKIKLVKI